MFCEQCGKQIPDNARFCDGCGAPVRSVNDDPYSRQATHGQNGAYWQQEPYDRYDQETSGGGYAPYGAPVPGGILPEEKTGKGATVLIAVLSVVAVALLAVLIFLGIRVFGGKKDSDNNGIGQAVIEESSGEEEETTRAAAESADVREPETKPGISIAPSQSVQIPTTAPVMTSETSEENEDFILPASNSAYLTEADLVGLTKEQLRFARNEIYARHGRIFKDDSLNQYFLSKSWYTPLVPADQFNENVFNDFENANRQLITNYEKKMGY